MCIARRSIQIRATNVYRRKLPRTANQSGFAESLSGANLAALPMRTRLARREKPLDLEGQLGHNVLRRASNVLGNVTRGVGGIPKGIR